MFQLISRELHSYQFSRPINGKLTDLTVEVESIRILLVDPTRTPYEQLKNAINRRFCYKKVVPLSTVGEWHCFDLENSFIWIIPDQVIYSISMLFYFAAPYDLSVLQIPCYHIGICFWKQFSINASSFAVRYLSNTVCIGLLCI